MTVEELVATLGLEVDAAAFKAGEAALESLHHGLLGLVAGAVAAAGAIGVSVHAASNYADEIDKASKRTGLGTDAFQELAYAAGLAGVSTGELEQGLKFLQRNAYEASQGNEELSQKFAELGINARTLQRLKPDQQLAKMADAFAKIEDPTKRAALASQLLSKAGTQLLPFLGEGSKSLEEMRLEARELGGVMDATNIKLGTELHDSVEKLQFAFGAMARELGTGFMATALETNKAILAWIKTNRALISQKIHAAIEAIHVAFKNVLQAARPFLEIFMAIITNGTIVKTILAAVALILVGMVGNAIAAAVVGLWGMVTAFVAMLPMALWTTALGIAFALLALGVILLMDEISTFNKGGDSFLKDWFGSIENLKNKITAFMANPLVKAFLAIGKAFLFRDFRDLAEGAASATLGMRDISSHLAGGSDVGFGPKYSAFGAGAGDAPMASYQPNQSTQPGGSTANITINAQTNATAQEIGLASRQAFDDHKLTEYRETHGVLRGAIP